MTLPDSSINRNVTHLNINMNQDPVVMQVLFSQLSNSNSVRSIVIESSNLSQWMKHIQKIGPFLLSLTIGNRSTKLSMIKTITEYCPYLEKLNCIFESDVSDSSNILQSIANNCPHIRNLDIKLMYDSSVLADADLTAFAEKCPQLEELSLTCQQLTDQSVIALAHHCSRLKKLKVSMCTLTAGSLIALSERGLPLEELEIPMIPIPSAEIAAQCAHALSRIRDLSSFKLSNFKKHLLYALQYMTGLRALNLWKLEDYLLVPHLLLLLHGYLAGLETLFIGPESGITPEQTYEIVKGCRNLHTIYINKDTCTSDAVIVKLANNCPHLQKVTLYCSSEVTEEGVLILAAHCRQLKVLHLHGIMLSVENVRQLALHCRRLTKLNVRVYRSIYMEGIVEYNKYYTRKDIRALRENPR